MKVIHQHLNNLREIKKKLVEMIRVLVAQDANINNVVVNKPTNPYKIRDCGFFYDYNIYVILDMSFVLDTFLDTS